MKKNAFAKIAACLGGFAVVVAGGSLPAVADPVSATQYGELVGFGSDTTMDVMDGIAASLGTNPDGSLKMASYKAVGSADVVTVAGGNAVPRANGSGAGKALLSIAIGQVASGTVAIALDDLGKARTAAVPTTEQLAGKVSFGRSSSGPSGAVANGVLTYIPFAYDNLTYATSADSLIPSDIPLGSAANTSEVSLTNIYKGNITQVITDSTSGAFVKLAAPSYTPAAGETTHTIHAYIPQAGSGTRSYWIGKVGITEANITAGTTAARDTFNGLTVQEHDGTALKGDPYAIVGFSISQWVAQTNGVATNRLQGAVLRSMGGVSPTVSDAGVYATNPAWTAIKRTVYNIVPTALANAATENAVTRAFVGTNSLVCQAKTVIQKFGYSLLSYEGVDATLGLTSGGAATICGNITEANRVSAPSTSSVTLGAPTVSASGTSATIVATVASNGNQGGVVNLYSGFGGANQALVASGTVAKGATTVEIDVTNTTSASTTTSLTAQFIPTLVGIDVSNSSVDGTSVTLKAATSVAFGEVTVAANGLSASFTATITGGTNGNLNIYDGAVSGTPFKTVAVTGATVSVTIDNVNNEAANYSLVGEFVPTDATAFATSRTSAASAVALRNAFTGTLTVASTFKTSVAPKVIVSLKNGKATSAVGAPGYVFAVVYNSKNVPVAVSSAHIALVNGAATVTFAKIATLGKYTVKVFYAGSSTNPAQVFTKTFSVVK
mgnify:FL=1